MMQSKFVHVQCFERQSLPSDVSRVKLAERATLEGMHLRLEKPGLQPDHWERREH